MSFKNKAKSGFNCRYSKAPVIVKNFEKTYMTKIVIITFIVLLFLSTGTKSKEHLRVIFY